MRLRASSVPCRDVTGQWMAGERGERRKSILPVGICLGHGLKKPMTVILIQMGRYRENCYRYRRIGPAHCSRFFCFIGKSLPVFRRISPAFIQY